MEFVMTTIAPPTSAGQTLSGFLDWIADRYTNQPALLYKPSLKTEVWTYRDLRDKADRVAAWLQEQGVRKGDRVALWGPNSPWWVASFFGILRNGSIVVPLDARSSPEFVDRVIAQSEPKLAIVSTAPARSWSRDIRSVSFDSIAMSLPARAPASLPEISGDDLAEIIFTSGTTGAPKGVMLSHSNIRSNVETVNQVFPAGPYFRPLSILPLSHLLEQTCGLLLALHGGTAIAYAKALQPAAIQRDMAEYRVSTMVLVPRILSLFMDAIERGVRKQGKERQWRLACRASEHLPMWARRIVFRNVIRSFGGRLQFLVTGGGPLEPELEHKWELLGIAILQGYGSTETSPIITASSLEDRKPRSVGKALPGTVLELSDEGEILVKGPNVMQGYWKNPEATAEVLQDGWYHTGDLGEIDAEGRLYLKGRKKNMIVLENGMNVFPEDVEEVLQRIPSVIESVVLPVPSQFGPQIHAVLLCRSQGGNPPDAAEIVRLANAQLAPHQHVRSYEIWPEPDFPRTHTAKIKRPEVAKYVLSEQRGEKVAEPQATLKSAKKPQLLQVLADVVGIPAAELTPETKVEDIGLDASRRIQLGRATEDRLGKFIDDSKIGPRTTVADLEASLSSDNPSGEHLYPLWPFSHRIRSFRSLIQGPIFVAERLIVQPRVLGAEPLDNLALPAIFVMEYESLLDAPVALEALPERIRQRVGISTTWKDGHKRSWVGSIVAFFFNSFRYASRGSLHATLVHASGLLDHGWSILFLVRPERSTAGQPGPVSTSVGLLAAEFAVPVVPLEISGLERESTIWRLPGRGSVTVRFGEPVLPNPDRSYHDVERIVEDAVSGKGSCGDPAGQVPVKAGVSPIDEPGSKAQADSVLQGTRANRLAVEPIGRDSASGANSDPSEKMA
jgi:long-chain acyl-CoA synthetase